ncbi:hypothetical protein K1719_022671 [Acacia pycnantha]|nr:hypothetical protein K1719_022671 [Acacia pycnantha]
MMRLLLTLLSGAVPKLIASRQIFAERPQGINMSGKVGNDQVNDHDMSDDSISDSEEDGPLCTIIEDPHRNFPIFSFSGKMKKRLYKAWNKAVVGSVEHQREKRPRELGRKVARGEILRLTYGEAKGEFARIEESSVRGVEDTLEVVPLEIDPPSYEADPFPESPPDPNAPKKPVGLLGKFWSGPDNVVLDCEMCHEDFSDAVEDSLVPETPTVYSIPSVAQKQLLWNALEGFASSIAIPWVILGDFNDIAAALEKTVYLEGADFGGRRIFERLDRALVNDSFLSSSMNCVLKVLPRTKYSDHNPIFLSWDAGASQNRTRDRPFRFEAMWLKHYHYKDFLEREWVSGGDINKSLDKLRDSLGTWNKNVFGLIERHKHVIMRRLEGIQCSPAYPRSQFLCSLEAELHDEFERLLEIEEIKWTWSIHTGKRELKPASGSNDMENSHHLEEEEEKMMRSLYEASYKGCALISLTEQDPLILD